MNNFISEFLTNDVYIYIFLVVSFIVLVSSFTFIITNKRGPDKLSEMIISKAEEDEKENPSHITPKYMKLYGYKASFIELNMKQNRDIYSLSKMMIAIGFAFMVFGAIYWVYIDFGGSTDKNSGAPLWIIVSGAFTQFIAGTVLLLYRAVFKQTELYFNAEGEHGRVVLASLVMDSISGNTEINQETKIKIKESFIKNILYLNKQDTSGGNNE